MPAKAIEKLNAEMTQNNTKPYIQLIGGFLLQHLDKNPLDAEKILVADKTISKSFDEMRKAAEKKKVGNCAVLTDQEGFAIVLKYFGIGGGAPAVILAPATVDAKPKTNDFNINLEDLL